MQRTCPYCSFTHSTIQNPDFVIIKTGSFYRKSDRKRVQRYKCGSCLNYFSSSTLTLNYGQKKRHLNHQIARLLVASTSLRESARVLKVNRKTISRKLQFMGKRAYRELKEFNTSRPKCSFIQFDDMETFEHTKCKPVSITLAVEEDSRRILDFQISKMPAKGLLAKKSVIKYGRREDERPKGRKALLKTLQGLCHNRVVIKTDESTHYIKDIKKYFPKGEHKTYKGRRGCVVGQGELKSGGYDPLFSLNHTAAMARYKISRLVRRTWCTTKNIERLKDHFALMSLHHNLSLQI